MEAPLLNLLLRLAKEPEAIPVDAYVIDLKTCALQALIAAGFVNQYFSMDEMYIDITEDGAAEVEHRLALARRIAAGRREAALRK